MEAKGRQRHIHPLWWTAGMFGVIIGMVLVCTAFFAGTFRSFVPVTLTSDRSGLVMEPGAKVKLRGVEVGRVAGVEGHNTSTRLRLQIAPDKVQFIPANVGAQIRATTVFGAKYVDLVYPEHPSAKHLAPGAVIASRNVSVEVNTVFENVVGVLKQIDPAKLNAVLSAFADGLRGQGRNIGEGAAAANEVLKALNPRMGTVAEDFRSLKGFSDAYGAAAQDIVRILDAASVTSDTFVNHQSDLDALLLNTIGLSRSGIGLLAPNRDNLVHAVNVAEPTTALLLKYNPVYTCTLQGVKWYLDKGAGWLEGMNGKSAILDSTFVLGNDPFIYPDNLPSVAAKGGPDGKPSCGSLPDASKNYPVRELVRNTGWGTGLDWRPNPGLGHPCWANYLPVTRAVPEPVSVRQCLPGPAIGPVPYPGAPPYGAPLYGADGQPLYPPPPGMPPPDPASPPPPSRTGTP